MERGAPASDKEGDLNSTEYTDANAGTPHSSYSPSSSSSSAHRSHRSFWSDLHLSFYEPACFSLSQESMMSCLSSTRSHGTVTNQPECCPPTELLNTWTPAQLSFWPVPLSLCPQQHLPLVCRYTTLHWWLSPALQSTHLCSNVSNFTWPTTRSLSVSVSHACIIAQHKHTHRHTQQVITPVITLKSLLIIEFARAAGNAVHTNMQVRARVTAYNYFVHFIICF